MNASIKCKWCGKYLSPVDPETGNRVACVTCCGQVYVLHDLDRRSKRTADGTIADRIQKARARR